MTKQANTSMQAREFNRQIRELLDMAALERKVEQGIEPGSRLDKLWARRPAEPRTVPQALKFLRYQMRVVRAVCAGGYDRDAALAFAAWLQRQADSIPAFPLGS
jgi:hypothetical protein